MDGSTEDWHRLSPVERAKRCRLLADQAKELAEQTAASELKQAYLDLAQQWSTLANEIEHYAP